MANEFDTGISQVLGGPMAPTPGVVDESTGRALSQVASLANSVTSVFGRAAAKQAVAEQNKYEGSVLTDVANTVTKLGRAVGQDKMSRSAALSRLQTYAIEMRTKNPTLTEKIDKVIRDTKGTNGLGHAIDTGSTRDQEFEAIYSDMAKNGYLIPPGLSESEQEELAYNYLGMQRSVRHLESIGKQLTVQTQAVNYAKANVTYDTAKVTNKKTRLAYTDAVLKHNANVAIADGAHNYFEFTQLQIKGLLEGFNPDTATPEEINSLTSRLALIKTQARNKLLSGGGAFADSSVTQNVLTPITGIVDNTIKYISGKITADKYQQDVELGKNREALKVLHLADPYVKRLIGAHAIFGFVDPNVFNVADTKAMEILGLLSTDPGKDKKQKAPNLFISPRDDRFDSVKGALSQATNVARQANLGTVDDKAVDDLVNVASNIMAGLSANGEKLDNLSDLKLTMDYLADPDNHKFIMSHKDQVKATGETSQTFQSILNRLVLPKVRDEWKNGVVYTGRLAPRSAESYSMSKVKPPEREVVPANTKVELKFVGGGPRFVPANPDDRYAIMKANSLNEDLAPVLNKSLRAYSTLVQTNNLKQIWDEVYAPYFESPDTENETE